RVLREFAEELERVAILSETIEQKADVVHGHGEDNVLAGRTSSAHAQLLSPAVGFCDRGPGIQNLACWSRRVAGCQRPALAGEILCNAYLMPPWASRVT